MESAASGGCSSEGLLGLELSSLMDAEPMTREEADLFDAVSMDECFVELQMFSLSSMGTSQQTSNTASASQAPGGGSQGKEWLHHVSRSSAEHYSTASNGQHACHSRESQFGEGTDSNRSSFETVQNTGTGQLHAARAAMQTSLYTNAPQCVPAHQLAAPSPVTRPASSSLDETLGGPAERRQERGHSSSRHSLDMQRSADCRSGTAHSVSGGQSPLPLGRPHERQVRLSFLSTLMLQESVARPFWSWPPHASAGVESQLCHKSVTSTSFV